MAGIAGGLMTEVESTELGELFEAWWTNHRINLYLIEQIGEEGMHCTLSKRGGRDVALQFAHLHNVRVWQLQKRAKDLSESLKVFPPKVHPSKAELVAALQQSAEAVETFFREAAEGRPRRRSFKKGLIVHLAYFVAHESHHRGNILLTLKEKGHNLDPANRYAIWDWDRI